MAAIVDPCWNCTRMAINVGPKNLVSLREQEVLNCLKNGCDSQEIADQLGITPRTVKFHIGNILRKLNASNRTQAVVLAMQQGLLD